jgi:hypothetical protein
MRGADEQQSQIFSYLSPEARVRKDHPLRADKAGAEADKVNQEASWTRQRGRKFIEVEWKPKTPPPPSRRQM